ncbi:MAG: hypothetical protein LBU65_16810, partial [Planctomycetaceae bacterium]|nr:hypothetical protein [Planctomycetaceae bacterium]
MTPTHTLIETTRDEFKNRFGVVPTWVVAAPGRINLIGEHTDYNDGFVLPLAIERYTVVAAAPSASALSSVYSMNKDEAVNVIVDKISDPPAKVTWDSYVQGTISCCREAGVIVNPFNAVINTDVPICSGLSSSAALEISFATLIEEMSGKKFDPVAKALTCQRTEHIYAKMPCGIMDQFISAMGVEGCAMLLDCRSKKTRMVPLSDTNIAVLAINSNVKHELTGSEYPERRRQCEEAAKAFGVKMLRDVSLFQLERRKKAL